MGRKRSRRAVVSTGVAALLAGCGAAGTGGDAGGRDSDGSDGTASVGTVDGTVEETADPAATESDALPDLDLESPDEFGLLAAPKPSDRSSFDYPTIGHDDATLTGTLFLGWKCPYTHELVYQHLDTIVEELVAPGHLQLRFQFVAYRNGEPFHGPDEPMVARVGHAVWEETPAEFFEYATWMWTNQELEFGWYTPDRLAAVADAAGVLSTERVRAVATSSEYETAIQATMDRVTAIPVGAIPRIHVSPAALSEDGAESDDPETVQGLLLAPTVDLEETVETLKAVAERQADGSAGGDGGAANESATGGNETQGSN